MHKICIVTLVVISAALVPGRVDAWGGEGHRIIGAMADAELKNSNAMKEVVRILKKYEAQTTTAEAKNDCPNVDASCTLQKYAVWADCTKGTGYCPQDAPGKQPWFDDEMQEFAQKYPKKDETGQQEFHRFHFTDVPVQEAKYIPLKAGGPQKHVGEGPDDAVQVLKECIAVLTSKGKDQTGPHKFTEKQALLLIIHLVGDIHQPLHVGALYLDDHQKPVNANTTNNSHATKGGNILYYTEKEELHAFWDSEVVNKAIAQAKTPEAGATALKQVSVPGTKGDDFKEWPEAWANETFLLAQTAYKGIDLKPACYVIHQKDKNCTDVFAVTKWPMYTDAFVKETGQIQLARAGHRLAELLKKIWP